MKSKADIFSKVITPSMTVVSFILILVVFLYEINYDTGFIFARPLVLILIATLFILYGLIIHIVSILKSTKKLFHISLTFYVGSIVVFIFAVDLLLVGIQGIEDSSIFHIIRVIVMSMGIVIVALLLGYFIFSVLKEKTSK